MTFSKTNNTLVKTVVLIDKNDKIGSKIICPLTYHNSYLES